MTLNQNITNEVRKILTEAFFGLRCQIRDEIEINEVMINKKKNESIMSESSILLI